MVSRAELLAGIEEKRLENKEIKKGLNELSIAGPEDPTGYDPYDNPSLGKAWPDGADITARRRRLHLRRR